MESERQNSLYLNFKQIWETNCIYVGEFGFDWRLKLNLHRVVDREATLKLGQGLNANEESYNAVAA